MKANTDSLRRVVGRTSEFGVQPDPPRGLKFADGKLSWEKPRNTKGLTHFNIYANTESNLVRRVPAGQLELQDNLTADRVFVSSFNAASNIQSSPVVLQQAVAPVATGGGTVQPLIGEVTDVTAADPVPVVVDGQTLASITMTAKAPAGSQFGTGDTEFAGVQAMIAFPTLTSDHGWQRPVGLAAGALFTFDLIVPYPAVAESWTIYLRARSETYVNALILSGTSTTPNAVVAMVPVSGSGGTQPLIGEVTDVSAAAPVPIVVDGQTVAKITITATAPVTAQFGVGVTEFAGVQSMLATPTQVYDQGWQRPAGIAAGAVFTFDLVLPYPAASESWTIYLRARSELYTNALILSGASTTPNVVVAMAPLSLTAAPNVTLYSAGTNDGNGTFTAAMYWEPTSKQELLVDWGCLAPTDRSNWSGVEIWIKTPNGLGGYDYTQATGRLGIDAFTESPAGSSDFVRYDVIRIEPAFIPVPPESWSFIAVSAAADANKTLNRTAGVVTGPTVTLTTLAKTDFVTGFAASVAYENTEAGDQLYRISGSWTNPSPFRYKGVRIVMRTSSGDVPLADEFEGSTSFLTDPFAVPSTSTAATIYAVPVFGDGSIGVIGGTTPFVALTIARQAGTTGAEYAPLVTSFVCGTPTYGINGAGQQTLFIPVTWTRPTTETFGGIILKMIRSSVHYTLSGVEPNSPNRIEINDFPSAVEVVTVYALSVDTNNRSNTYQTTGANITPSASVTLPVPTRVPTGSGFSVTYTYNKLTTGQTVLEITPVFTAPTSAQFAWFDFWGKREDGLWYPLGSPDQGGLPGMATVHQLPAISFTWDFALIPNDINGKDRDGNATSNPASPPSGTLTTTKLIDPLKTNSPLGQVTSYSVQYQYTAPDANGAQQLLLNPVFTPPTDPTWAYVDFWAKREDGVWYQLGSPGAGTAFVGAIPGPGVATIAQLPAVTFTWTFAFVSRNANNQDLAGNYSLVPGTWPSGTPTTTLSIAPPGVGAVGVERTSNVVFNTTFNGGVNPQLSYPARADGTQQLLVSVKLDLPTTDPSWGGFDLVTVTEDVSTGLIDTSSVPFKSPRLTGIKTEDGSFNLNIPASLARVALFAVSFDKTGRRNTINYTELGLGGTLTPRKDFAFGSASGVFDPRKYDPATTSILSVVGSVLKLSSGSVENTNLLHTGTNRIIIVDADILDLAGGKLNAGSVSTAKLDTTEIQVGGGGGRPGVFNVYGSGGTNIGFIGVSGADEGGWFKTGGFGGTSFATAVVKATSSGVTINGASLVLNLNGVTTTIANSSAASDFAGLTVKHNSSPAEMGIFRFGFRCISPNGAQVAHLLGTNDYGIFQLYDSGSRNSIDLFGDDGEITLWNPTAFSTTITLTGTTGAISASGNVTIGGQLRLGGSISAGSPASAATKKIPVYDSAGTFLNYLYLYP